MIKNPIQWPNGAKCACAITFDIDADSLIHISKPTDGHNRLYPISMGKYGPEVAIPRILETFKKLGIKQTFFAPGWVIEQYPQAMESIMEGGHEIAHHGYLHEDPTGHGPDEQRYWFERAIESHQKVLGQKPKGYRAPVYNVNPTVIDLLNEHDFLYESSLMGDDIPYILQSGQKKLVEMPVHWGNDDWPPFAHYPEIGYMMPVSSPSQGLDTFWQEFEAQYANNGFWMSIWHPFLTGRLARWHQVEKWLESTLENNNVWFATLSEIAQHVKKESEKENNLIRVDHLPYYQRPVKLNR
ncbi:polysaccharide deacetylase family protein [Pelagibaculum spongiae]|uniref:Ribulose phosphate epimerase n=1 Tax=Pelagibaculum spongiae TaxID=2080658 RepID=A0A2V1H2B9_9GAMM|nr:polysaccharide deacetylase [Pelagibaculum spongiae]PVZ70159.1 ribulose phosphate epimerase [Pelagibaculum spongiae]